MSAVHHLPEGWQKLSLHQVAEIQTGIAKGKKEDIVDPVECPYLRVANVQDGHLDLSEIKTITVARKEVGRYSLRRGDVLMTEGGDFDKLGRGTVWEGQIQNCLHQNHVFVVRPARQRLNPYFLSYQTGSLYGKSYFKSCSKQSTNLASINSSQLKEFPVLLPPLKEQKVIAEVLQTWDRAIEIIERLIVAKQERRTWLMQQLLTGKRRLPGFSKKWQMVQIGEIVEEISIRNQRQLGADAVRAVNKAEGMIPMRDQVMADDLSRYKVVEKNWFAYNPMRINIGSICQLLNEDKALVSPDYVVFRCKESKIDHRFFNAFRQSHRWRSFMDAAGNGSVRVRIYFDDLGRLKMPLPPLEEQCRIAGIMGWSARETDILRSQLDALREQKKGLMQQLLLGRTRLGLMGEENDR